MKEKYEKAILSISKAKNLEDLATKVSQAIGQLISVLEQEDAGKFTKVMERISGYVSLPFSSFMFYKDDCLFAINALKKFDESLKQTVCPTCVEHEYDSKTKKEILKPVEKMGKLGHEGDVREFLPLFMAQCDIQMKEIALREVREKSAEIQGKLDLSKEKIIDLIKSEKGLKALLGEGLVKRKALKEKHASLKKENELLKNPDGDLRQTRKRSQSLQTHLFHKAGKNRLSENVIQKKSEDQNPDPEDFSLV